MTIIITGANGMLGKDLTSYLRGVGYSIIAADHNCLDICNNTAVLNFLKDNPAEMVVNCAAYTNVDKAEIEKDKCYDVNVNGVHNLINACNETNTTLLQISTDYVFDGKRGYYSTDDIPSSINFYGETKLQAEKLIQAKCKKYKILRVSWLYGQYGKNFVETMIANKDKPLRVVNDQFGQPTWTIEVCKAIERIYNNIKSPQSIFHLASTNIHYITWYDFAEEIFKQLNYSADLSACKSSEYASSAKRPNKSCLIPNTYTEYSWQQQLNIYLNITGRI